MHTFFFFKLCYIQLYKYKVKNCNKRYITLVTITFDDLHNTLRILQLKITIQLACTIVKTLNRANFIIST